jgi:hypothetical protein
MSERSVEVPSSSRDYGRKRSQPPFVRAGRCCSGLERRAGLARARLGHFTSLLWLVALLFYAAAAVWLFSHPAAIPSDDALYFSRSLLRFNTLDFSPQFPGYPGFVLLGRAVRVAVPDSQTALFLLTAGVALLIPPVAASIVWNETKSSCAALSSFVITMTQPLLPDLGLNMTSDGAGVLFLLVYIWLLPSRESATKSSPMALRRDLFICGLALGWAACCRPSDAALYVGALFGLTSKSSREKFLRTKSPSWSNPLLGRMISSEKVRDFSGSCWSAFAPVVVGALAIGLPTLLVLYGMEGPLYWSDGLRFVSGHAELWGNTLFSHHEPSDTWLVTWFSTPWSAAVSVLSFAVLCEPFVRRSALSPRAATLLGSVLFDLVWVVVFQNPDHLRHLAPIAILIGVMLPLAARNVTELGAATACALVVNLGMLFSTLTIKPNGPRWPSSLKCSPMLRRTVRFRRTKQSKA